MHFSTATALLSLLSLSVLPSVTASSATSHHAALLHKRQPYPFHKVDRSSLMHARHNNGTSVHDPPSAPAPRPAKPDSRPAATRKAAKRQDASRMVKRGMDASTLLARVTAMLGGMKEAQGVFHGSILSLQRNPSVGKKHRFQQDVHRQLAAYRRACSDFPVLSAAAKDLRSSIDDTGLSAEHGTANLDRCNKAQTVLNAANRSVQEVLADVDLAVYSSPVLGNELGTLVYDIKCLIDALLDATVNVVDGTLNSSDELSSLSSSLGETACRLVPGLEGCDE